LKSCRIFYNLDVAKHKTVEYSTIGVEYSTVGGKSTFAQERGERACYIEDSVYVS